MSAGAPPPPLAIAASSSGRASSISRSVMTYGGSSRTTVSDVRLTSSLRSQRRLDDGAAGRSSSRPHIRPAPRTSLTAGWREAIARRPRFEVRADAGDVLHQPAARPARRGRRAPRGTRAGCRRRCCRDRPGCAAAATCSDEQRRADRHAGAERLAERHQVRLQAERGRVERPPGAAEAALHFVGDEQRAGAAARRRRSPSAVALRDRPHAAFALDRLDDDRGCIRRDRRGNRRGVVGSHERHAAAPAAANGVAIVLVPRHRQRAHRPAVERVLKRDELRRAASPCACQ